MEIASIPAILGIGLAVYSVGMVVWWMIQDRQPKNPRPWIKKL